jgi:hypothetical protein
VIDLVPALAYDTSQVATPEALSVAGFAPAPAHATSAVPSLKVTLPVGVPPPGLWGATVAVYLTVWPVVDGFTEEVRVVVVFALFTVWVMAEEVDPTKEPAPENTAVIECEPAEP